MKAKPRLPANHLRSLSVTADAVERGLREMEETLRQISSDTSTRKIHQTYSDTERQRLLDVIAQMRKTNREMIDALNLEISEFREDQIINARVAHLWTILIDSKSKRLKNFGEVPKDVAPDIDRYIDKLLETLKGMM